MWKSRRKENYLFMKVKVSFKALSPKKKAEFIWDYYRYAILTAGCAVVLLVVTVAQIASHREPVLNVIMVNSLILQSEPGSGFDEFLVEYGYEQFAGAIDNHQLYVSDGEANGIVGYRMLASELAAGGRDVFLGEAEILMSYAQAGALRDLREILPGALLTRYADSLLYTDENGKTEPYPCAVVLSENPWLSENQYYYGTCCLGILYRGDHPEAAARFAEFLLTAE